MEPRPYVIISTAMSLDGFIDDTSEERLVLSNEKDFERVKELRESCDAILVGANTIRKDNPKLLSKSEKKLTKVTITSSGNIDGTSQFFAAGESEKLVYTLSSQVENVAAKLPQTATVIGGGDIIIDFPLILADLYTRGVKRLLVEGGSMILTQFLQLGLVDELQIAIAGFFVGQKDAPRFAKPGTFPWNKDNRLHLESVTALDDIAVLVYKNLPSPIRTDEELQDEEE